MPGYASDKARQRAPKPKIKRKKSWLNKGAAKPSKRKPQGTSVGVAVGKVGGAPKGSTSGVGAGVGIGKSGKALKKASESTGPLRFSNDAAGRRARKNAPKVRTAGGDAKILGVALKILEQTNRPVHAIAGGSRAAIRGENVLKAAGRGATLKDKYLFSDTLKELGAPKGVQIVGGTALDIVADPTTIMSAGTSQVGKKVALKAAEKAGDKAAKQALKAGASRTQIRKAKSQASRAAYSKQIAKRGKGLQVGVKGKVPFGPRFEAKTSGKATARIVRATGAGKVATKVRESEPAQRFGKDFVPGFRPKDRTPEQHEAYRASARSRGAGERSGRREAERHMLKMRRAIKPDEYSDVIAAREGVIPFDVLKPKAKEAAEAGAKRMARQASREKDAGVLGATRENYVYHLLNPEAEKAAKQGVRGRSTTAPSSKQRKDIRPIREQKNAGKDIFSEDLPLVDAIRIGKGQAAVANKKHQRNLLQIGRPATPKSVERMIPEREAVYKQTPGGISEVAGKDIPKTLKDAKKGEVVILPKSIGDKEVQHFAARDEGFRRYLDRAVGTWKSTVTTMNAPAFQLRNLSGDIQFAYNADTDVKSLIQGIDLSNQLRKVERADEKLGRAYKPRQEMIDLGPHGKVSRKEFIGMLDELGVARSGSAGGEWADLAAATSKGKVKKIRKGVAPVTRLRHASETLEDGPRIGTFLSAMRRGMTKEQARAHADKFHIDYTDLSEVEKKIRATVIPFYTFASRNTINQTRQLLTRPGKLATIEKVRQEAANAAGLPDNWEETIKDYEQKGLPVPVRINGKVKLLFIQPPAQDLGRLPIGKPDAEFMKRQADMFFQMLNPIIKTGTELPNNYSFFFREGIYRDDKNPTAPKWVPAPKFAKWLPGPLKKQLHVIEDFKGNQLAWSPVADYIFRLTPQSGLLSQLATEGKNRRGQSSTDKLIGQATGARIGNVDAKAREQDRAYDERTRLDIELRNLRDRNIYVLKNGEYDPRYYRVLEKKRELEKKFGLKKKRIRPRDPGAGSNPADTLFNAPASKPNPADRLFNAPEAKENPANKLFR